jgi:hypothetical protein
MYERRGVDLVRPLILFFFSLVIGSSCFLPPDPPRVEEEESQEPELIQGAWMPVSAAGDSNRDQGDSVEPFRWDAGRVVMAGRWSAEVVPRGSETMPEVSVSLFDAAEEGNVVGTATYSFANYACHYALVLESTLGNTVQLSQRFGVGPCAEAGRIVLEWDGNDDLVGDWRRPDGSRWFRVRLTLAPAPDVGVGAEPGDRWPQEWNPGPR